MPLTPEGPLRASLHFRANELQLTQLPLVSGMGKLRQGELTRLAQSHTPKADLLPFGLHPTCLCKNFRSQKSREILEPRRQLPGGRPSPGVPLPARRRRPGCEGLWSSAPRGSSSCSSSNSWKAKTRVGEGGTARLRGTGNPAMKYPGQNP